MNRNTLQILQDVLENTVYSHRVTLSPTSRLHSDDAKGSTEQELPSETDFAEGCNGTDNGIDSKYLVGKTVRYIGLNTRLRYVLRWYGYRKADNTAKPPTIYLNTSSKRTCDDSTGKKG